MAVETFNKLCYTVNRPTLLSPTGVVCALGGQPLDVIGEMEVRVSGAGPITVLVTRSFPHELLLSSDAIDRGNGILDYKNDIFHWYGQELSTPGQVTRLGPVYPSLFAPLLLIAM